jgi:hypothetical protein
MVERVFITGWIVAGALLELRSQGSFLLDNLDFPSRVGFIVLDDSLQNNVLLPFLAFFSGLYTRFLYERALGRQGMEKLFISDTVVH